MKRKTQSSKALYLSAGKWKFQCMIMFLCQGELLAKLCGREGSKQARISSFFALQHSLATPNLYPNETIDARHHHNSMLLISSVRNHSTTSSIVPHWYPPSWLLLDSRHYTFITLIHYRILSALILQLVWSIFSSAYSRTQQWHVHCKPKLTTPHSKIPSQHQHLFTSSCLLPHK